MGIGESKEKIPQNMVVLHGGYERGVRVPSMSPYVMKLETFLRMNRVLYMYTEEGGFGEKGKVPWIEYRREKICDSHFIIQHLNKKAGIDLDWHLNDYEKALSIAFRIMVEEFLHLTNGLELLLWSDPDRIKEYMDLSTPMIWVQKAKMSVKMKSQGIGSHSQEEVRQLTEDQLFALSNLLGEKQYMMGDIPTELDCSVFGVLSIMRYCMDTDMHPRFLIQDNYKNLNEYLDRMKTNFWPDWDDLLEPFEDEDESENSTAISKAEAPSLKIIYHSQCDIDARLS